MPLQKLAFISLFAAWIACLSANAAPPLAPTNLQAAAPEPNSLTASWEDNSDDETGFRLEFRIPPEVAWNSIFTYGVDVTSASLTGGTTGLTYEFQVVAVNDDGETPSEIATVTVPNVFNGDPYAHVQVGVPFSRTISTTNAGGSATVAYSIQGSLPDGLNFDPETNVISGTATVDGYFPTTVTVTFADPPSPTIERGLAFRIPPLRADPVETTPIAFEPLSALGEDGTVDLSNHLRDPDTTVAVEIATSAGDMVFSLFDRALPLPVANFLNYVDRADYSEAIFHRSVDAGTFDIIQSGSFTGDAVAATAIPTDPPIVNAPGIPNDRGTLAFARTSVPDSATAGWYINAQNSPGLDAGDSYAVFGRATDASFPAIDTIFGYPTDSHPLTIDGSTNPFAGFPTTDGNAPTNGPPSNLIKVNSVTRVPALTYAVTANSAPSVATAAQDGASNTLRVSPLAAGTTEISLSATDIDGNTVTSSFVVTVLQSYSAWAAGTGAPSISEATSRPAGGVLSYTESYAFGGSPLDPSDDSSLLPAPTTAEIEGIAYDAFTFRHRTSAADLSYAAQVSTDLETWTPIWQTSDGFDAANVASASEDGEFTTLVVRNGIAASQTAAIFFRTAVTLSTPPAP